MGLGKKDKKKEEREPKKGKSDHKEEKRGSETPQPPPPEPVPKKPPSPPPAELNQIIEFQRQQQKKLEAQIHQLYESLENVHIIGPDATISSSMQMVLAARSARQKFSPTLCHSLATIAGMLESFTPVTLPGLTDLYSAHDLFESSQERLRQRVIMRSTEGGGGSPASSAVSVGGFDDTELQQLIETRDTASVDFQEAAQSFLTDFDGSEYGSIQHELENRAGTLDAILSLFPQPDRLQLIAAEATIANNFSQVAPALGIPPEYVQNIDSTIQLIQQTTQTYAEEAIVYQTTTEQSVAALQAGLTGLADLLGTDTADMSDEPEITPLGDLLQAAEVSACEEIVWLQRHEERCLQIQNTVVLASHALRLVIRHTMESIRHIQLLSVDYGKLVDALANAEKPDVAYLQKVRDNLKEVRVQYIHAKARAEAESLDGEDPSNNPELQALQQQMQCAQVNYETELRQIAATTMSLYPEIPLMNSNVDTSATVGIEAVDGLWLKSRKIEDYEEKQRFTGGKHIVIVAEFAGKLCVLKEYNLADMGPCLTTLKQELLVLARLDHPHIVKIEGFILDTRKKKAYIQMPFYQFGSLTNWVVANPNVPPDHLKQLLVQVVLGIMHMHSNNVVHCGIRPNNILVSDDAQEALIADFDVSKHVDQRLMDIPGFSAAVPKANDIFAFGTLAHFVMTKGEYPLFGDELNNGTRWIRGESVPADSELSLMLTEIFGEDAEMRPTADMVLESQFFSGASHSTVMQQRVQLRDELEDARCEHQLTITQVDELLASRDAYIEQQEAYIARLLAVGTELANQLEMRRALTATDLVGKSTVKQHHDQLAEEQEQIREQCSQLQHKAEAVQQQHTSVARVVKEAAIKLQQVEKQQVDNNHAYNNPPLYWAWVDDSFGQQLVDVSADMLEKFQTLFTYSMADTVKVHRSLCVTKVERIENCSVWRNYLRRRHLLQLCNSYNNENKSISEVTVATDYPWLQDYCMMNEVNEKLLLWGAPSKGAATHMWLGSGLRAQRHGPYGRGLYFSENSCCADAMAEPDESGICYIVVCRVTLGCTVECETALQHSLRLPPPTHDIPDIFPAPYPRYDSVWGLATASEASGRPPPADTVIQGWTPQKYRVFVLYDGRLAYPEYIVTYQRSMPNVPPTSPMDYAQAQQMQQVNQTQQMHQQMMQQQQLQNCDVLSIASSQYVQPAPLQSQHFETASVGPTPSVTSSTSPSHRSPSATPNTFGAPPPALQPQQPYQQQPQYQSQGYHPQQGVQQHTFQQHQPLPLNTVPQQQGGEGMMGSPHQGSQQHVQTSPVYATTPQPPTAQSLAALDSTNSTAGAQGGAFQQTSPWGEGPPPAPQGLAGSLFSKK